MAVFADAGPPLIAVTVRSLPQGASREQVESAARSARFYADAVRRGGGEPVFVTTSDPPPARYLGLLLGGGPDLHPRHFGQEIEESVRHTLTIDEERDELELRLAREALASGVPILAICRGVQLLNAAAGGSLWQDLSLAGADPAAHNQDGRLDYWEAAHDVSVRSGSLLAALLGEGKVGVNSFHHQAVRDTAPGLEVSAVATDGTVEAIEGRPGSFVIGVQWHPERMVEHHPEQLRLFSRLASAALAGG